MAILLVFVFHYNIFNHNNLITKFFHFLFSVGWSGVDLFFVISSFLITTILIKSKDNPRYYLTFYARRILRIFPIYYINLLLFFFILPLLFTFSSDGYNFLKENQIFLWFYLQNFLIAKYNEWLPFHMNHLWSLAIEEQYYLIWPFIVKKLSLKSLINFSIAILLGSLIIRIYLLHKHGTSFANTLYVLPYCRMDCFAVGSILAIFHQRPIKIAKDKTIKTTVRVGVLAFLLLLFSFSFITFFSQISIGMTAGFFFIAFIWGSFLSFTISSSEDNYLNKFLRRKFLCLIGKLSYGIYLYHFPLLGFYYYITPNEIQQKIAQNFILWIIFIVIMFIFNLILAWLSWSFIEIHFLKLKKNFTYKKVCR